MAYIGKSPSTKFSAAAKVDTFTGDGSTTTFDLANIIPAGGENGLQVFVNNVRQKPGASNAFTVGNDGSGDLKRITFTAAPDASDEIYVITTFEATNITEVGDGTITSAKIADGTIANADVSPSAAIADSKLATLTTASKVNVSALSAPGSASVFLRGDRTYGSIPTDDIDTNAFNISLLGFKMAVNEGLTVFNLIDGIVDEFHDESGTDEAEGSNDTYNSDSDFYVNDTSPTGVAFCAPVSAGFSISAVTEPDTSTAGTHPTAGAGTYGAFTVPTGMTSASIKLWGAGGGAGGYNPNGFNNGGGGGFVEGTLAVTASQVLEVVVSEGGAGGTGGQSSFEAAFGGRSNPGEYPSPGAPHGFDNACQGGGGSTNGLYGGLGGGTGAIGTSATIGFPQGAPALPGIALIAGAGGGGGDDSGGGGGAGGGTTGDAGGQTTEQTNANGQSGGGGDQEQGGQGGPSGGGTGGLFYGGTGKYSSGGGGYYGGGGMGYPSGHTSNGGGSSYHGHPQITSGSTEEGQSISGGGESDPQYVASTNDGGSKDASPTDPGDDGYALITGTSSITASTLSTTIISNAFTSTSVPTTSRIVVFEENVETPTINTDIIASISRDGGSTFTTATLTDSGYVTGSSGQRILTGQATISGQPSGQSMRWKLALANNTVKIHGVSLQWS